MIGHGVASQMIIDGLTLQLAGHLVRTWSTQAGRIKEDAPVADALDWRVRRAIEYLEAHLAEDVGLAEIATVVGLSTRHLTMLFHAAGGETPHRWLTRRRFERTCEMLADPRRTVTDVALACGFASSQHLATVFQKRLAITPSAYRRERLR